MTESDHRPPNGFLAGINPRYFIDCYEEWHAVVQGWCEGFMPWPRPRHIDMSPILQAEITKEHHYYMGGRIAGMIAAVVFWALIGRWIIGWFL